MGRAKGLSDRNVLQDGHWLRLLLPSRSVHECQTACVPKLGLPSFSVMASVLELVLFLESDTPCKPLFPPKLCTGTWQSPLWQGRADRTCRILFGTIRVLLHVFLCILWH